MPSFEELLEAWDGETAVIRRDLKTGGWIFICIHSTRRGPAGGGTRLKVYPTPADALGDAMRLARAMTRKLAVAELPFGGGKAVIAVPGIPEGAERRDLLLRYGDLIESLGGTYRTSSDMNTGEADMDIIGERTGYVFGRSPAAGGAGDPAQPTAMGVFHGIRASIAQAFGSDEFRGRTVLIQGAGGVGSRLAAYLAGAGASVLVADVDAGRAQEVAERHGVSVVAPTQIFDTAADVYAPCALGGVLTVETAARVRCRVVAGSANNQLAEPSAAEVLRDRGVVYAPDYVINAGGAIALVGLEQLGWSDHRVDAALSGIGGTLRAIYRLSERDGLSTAAAADALADERLVSRA